jgi:hypothetical protein
MEKEYKIYKLVLDGEVVYVGITTYKKLSQRKNRHNCADTFERVRESEIELIEITNDKSRERFWIDYYLNKDCKLFNKTKGNGFNSQGYYEENKEDIIENAKKYYKENKEEIIEYRKKYQQENKDKVNQYNREYYERKKEEKRIYYKKYREQNKQKLKEQENKI